MAKLLHQDIEIIPPRKTDCASLRGAIACLCCGEKGQPMDDDGCGICDACLGLPLPTVDEAGGLELPAAYPHLGSTARHR